jgi:hypothetical protein
LPIRPQVVSGDRCATIQCRIVNVASSAEVADWGSQRAAVLVTTVCCSAKGVEIDGADATAGNDGIGLTSTIDVECVPVTAPAGYWCDRDAPGICLNNRACGEESVVVHVECSRQRHAMVIAQPIFKVVAPTTPAPAVASTVARSVRTVGPGDVNQVRQNITVPG